MRNRILYLIALVLAIVMGLFIVPTNSDLIYNTSRAIELTYDEYIGEVAVSLEKEIDEVEKSKSLAKVEFLEGVDTTSVNGIKYYELSINQKYSQNGDYYVVYYIYIEEYTIDGEKYINSENIVIDTMTPDDFQWNETKFAHEYLSSGELSISIEGNFTDKKITEFRSQEGFSKVDGGFFNVEIESETEKIEAVFELE